MNERMNSYLTVYKEVLRWFAWFSRAVGRSSILPDPNELTRKSNGLQRYTTVRLRLDNELCEGTAFGLKQNQGNCFWSEYRLKKLKKN